MVDFFSLGLTHALLALAAWQLIWRDGLDRDPEPASPSSQSASGPGSGPASEPGDA